MFWVKGFYDEYINIEYAQSISVKESKVVVDFGHNSYSLICENEADAINKLNMMMQHLLNK